MFGARVGVVAVMVVCSTACIESASVVCGDRLCPPDTVCNPRAPGCLLREQLEPCVAAIDGTPCNFTGAPDGVCHDDICYARGCGDGFVDPFEDCEPAVAVTATCLDVGFEKPEGTVTCRDDCRFDVSQCSERCGDGRQFGPEACDQADLAGRTCLDFGFYAAGGLACAPATCTFLTTGCGGGSCGNDLIEGPELCEPALPVGQTCIGVGFDGGPLGCSQACAYDLTSCRVIGWQNVISGTPQYIYGFWGATANDLWAVGGKGEILHWNGSSWEELGSPTTNRLGGVWGAAANDIWAVGEAGTFVHYDGTAWTASTVAGVTTELHSIWGAATDDIWAVGVGGVLVHYDGSSWTKLVPAPTAETLLDVSGVDGNNIWAVGTNRVVLHYTGGVWTTVDSGEPSAGEWRGVYARAASDLFVVGTGPVIRHYDGAWTAAAIKTTHFLNAIGSYGNGEVVAVGNSGTFVHFDGHSWMTVQGRTGQDLQAVWNAGGESWAGGESGALQHIAGNDLLGEVASPVTTLLAWYGIAGTSLSDIYVVGDNGLFGHFDGSLWTSITPVPATTAQYIGVWATAGVAYAVGTAGKVCRLQPTSATCATRSTHALLGVWGSSATDIWATGDSGALLHSADGTTWVDHSADVSTLCYFNDVGGTGASAVFAPASLGRVARYDGTAWTVDTPAIDALVGVWGRAADEVYVVGDDGVMLRYDGAVWSPVPTGTLDPLIEIDGDGSHALAVGRNGAIVELSNGMWTPTRSPVAIDLNGVYVSGDTAYIVGDSGTLLKYRWY